MTTDKETKKYYKCEICGFCPTNRIDWCDLGCGRDYNRMIEVIIVSADLTKKLRNRNPYQSFIKKGDKEEYLKFRGWDYACDKLEKMKWEE